MFAHRASSGLACGPSGRGGNHGVAATSSTPPVVLLAPRRRLQQQQVQRRKQQFQRCFASVGDAPPSTTRAKKEEGNAAAPKTATTRRKRKASSTTTTSSPSSSPSASSAAGTAAVNGSVVAAGGVSAAAAATSSSAAAASVTSAAPLPSTLSPPSLSALAPPGSKPRPDKAELYLYRTDGRSCTRETVQAGGTLKLVHPSTQQQLLVWRSRPRSVLVLKRLGEESREEFAAVVDYLGREQGMLVLVEPHELERTAEALLAREEEGRVPAATAAGATGGATTTPPSPPSSSSSSSSSSAPAFLDTYTEQEASSLASTVDFVVCLGGDGLVLHASSLFRNAIPPVISFNMGSLGFLTNHSYHEHREALAAVINGRERLESCSSAESGGGGGGGNGAAPANDAGVHITLRMRLECQVVEGATGQPRGEAFEVLNEVVVDRGASPYLTKIECWERGRLVTKVQADGVMLATTTGSTAYSVAAGGSMVHPNVPAILFTPICPHSLSFRPVVLPDYAELELRIAGDMRCTAWACFDGKHRRELLRGDAVRVRMSANPVPTISKADSTNDWFDTLNRCFGWNERLEQKPYWGGGNSKTGNMSSSDDE